MRKRKTIYAWMLALMICSQIMLTGFVSYWLIAQYRQERLHLHARLQDMYYSAYDAQVDSLLVTHLIAPTLNDSVTLSVDLSRMPHIYPGTDSVRTAVVIKQLDEDNLAGPDVFAFRMADSVGIEEERMVRSVRLFINKTEESFRNDTLAHAFSMKIDSTALLKMLNERFEEMDWNFTMYWQPESIQSGNAPGNHGMVLSSGPHMELTALHIDHITPYLLGLMLPQFIFALLLLGLSASALIIAYRSLKKQVALNILRNDFMANISHELKTPVSTVKVALEALQKFDLKKDPKVSGDYLDLASREVDRLEGLVGKVLRHQVLEDSEVLLQKVSCDLNLLMDSAAKAMEIHIREKEATVKTELAATPCMVRADPEYLEAVIINLIDNSLKYSGPGPRIHLSVDCEEGRKRVKVRDSGPGIPEEFKKQVYDKFFRVPAGNRHNVKGYGLGLNFAALVMAQLGGSISFRNLPEGGCEFILDFPNN